MLTTGHPYPGVFFKERFRILLKTVMFLQNKYFEFEGREHLATPGQIYNITEEDAITFEEEGSITVIDQTEDYDRPEIQVSAISERKKKKVVKRDTDKKKKAKRKKKVGSSDRKPKNSNSTNSKSRKSRKAKRVSKN